MLNLVSFQSINQRAKRQAERQYTQFQTSDYNPAITIGTFLTTVTCVYVCNDTCIFICNVYMYTHTHTHTHRGCTTTEYHLHRCWHNSCYHHRGTDSGRHCRSGHCCNVSLWVGCMIVVIIVVVVIVVM